MRSGEIMKAFKKIIFNPIKSIFCVICIWFVIFFIQFGNPKDDMPEYLTKELGEQLFYTNDYSTCYAAVYSFSDEWYENIKPIISKREWWQITPIDDDIEDGRSLKTRSFTAAWCNGGFKEYSDIFFEAIKVKGNDYDAGNVSFVLIAKKEKLLFITTAK